MYMSIDTHFCFWKRHVTIWIWSWTSKWDLSNIHTDGDKDEQWAGEKKRFYYGSTCEYERLIYKHRVWRERCYYFILFVGCFRQGEYWALQRRGYAHSQFRRPHLHPYAFGIRHDWPSFLFPPHLIGLCVLSNFHLTRLHTPSIIAFLTPILLVACLRQGIIYGPSSSSWPLM